jgi:ribosomal protein S18 acetylase RimI-like enzyme
VTPAPTLRDAAAVLAAAFADGALFVHVEPDAERRVVALRWLWQCSLLHCSRHGGVEVVGDPHDGGGAAEVDGDGAAEVDGGTAAEVAGVRAVAGWVPGQRLSLTAADLVRTGLVAAPARLGPSATRRLERHERGSEPRLLEALDDDAAYLWVLGVDPALRGRGLGRAALEAALEAMVRAGHDRCVLRTDDEQNVPWYRRQGFEVVERLDDLPSGLPAWVLTREASTG